MSEKLLENGNVSFYQNYSGKYASDFVQVTWKKIRRFDDT